MSDITIFIQQFSFIEIGYKEKLLEWKNVTVFHSLALLMGPLIESIALMDKFMYLVESGIFSIKLF